jgi:hypothetical protein
MAERERERGGGGGGGAGRERGSSSAMLERYAHLDCDKIEFPKSG